MLTYMLQLFTLYLLNYFVIFLYFRLFIYLLYFVLFGLFSLYWHFALGPKIEKYTQFVCTYMYIHIFIMKKLILAIYRFLLVERSFTKQTKQNKTKK